MELFAALLVGSAILAAAIFISQQMEKARLGTWAAAARLLNLGGIVQQPRSWRLGSRLTCTSQGLGVALESYQESKYDTGTRIVVDGLGHGAEPLTLRSEGVGTRIFGREIEVGDPAFDSQVFIQGPEALALAVLDAPARTRFARLLRGEAATQQNTVEVKAVALERGVLEVRVNDRHAARSAEQIAQVLQSTLESAHSLAAPSDLPARLAQNFRCEPVDGVRLRLLQVLDGEYPDRPETRQALRDALQDKSSRVRLHAALNLGTEGHGMLRDFAVCPQDSYAARAVTALGGSLTLAELDGILEQALAGRRTETAGACLVSLGHRGPAAEALLLQALGSGDPEITEAAARALGEAGTADAVAPLGRAADQLLPSPIRSAARQAITEIQARLTGAAPGQLSLAAGEAGALALAGEAGELSLAGAEPAEWAAPRPAESEPG